jgi:F-type H+-transporting ATPase subunit epsilon
MELDLTIVTPDGEAYAGSVDRVVLPGSEGDFGVLPGHERFLSPLRIGEVEIRERTRSLWAAVSDGFAEVTGQHVVVMVETCELADRIDRDRAERARQRRERELAELARTEAEQQRFRVARAGLERAVTRLSVVRKSR